MRPCSWGSSCEVPLELRRLKMVAIGGTSDAHLHRDVVNGKAGSTRGDTTDSNQNSTLAGQKSVKNSRESDLNRGIGSLPRLNSTCVVVAIWSSPPKARKVVRYVSWTPASPPVLPSYYASKRQDRQAHAETGQKQAAMSLLSASLPLKPCRSHGIMA